MSVLASLYAARDTLSSLKGYPLAAALRTKTWCGTLWKALIMSRKAAP